MATSKKAGAPARSASVTKSAPEVAAKRAPKVGTKAATKSSEAKPKVAAKHASVEAYLAAQPPESRAVLERVRAALRRALPEAEEVISYQIPALRAPGGVVVFFAGWARHYSLYPASAGVVSALGAELEPYEVNHKGTVRFPLDAPVPEALLERFAALRAREVDDEARAKDQARAARRKAR